MAFGYGMVMNEPRRKQRGIVFSHKVSQSGLHTLFTAQAPGYVNLRTNQKA